MPWSKVEDHPDCGEGEIAVVNDESGAVEGCHETEASADDQLAALNASEEEGNAAPGADQVFAFPMRVQLPVYEGDEIDALLALARAAAADPDSIDPERSFFFPGEISSGVVDAYFTHMDESSLRNYAADADAGVSLQNSHRHTELGFGRSLRGVYDEAGDGRVIADFFTERGLNLNGVNTDDLIRGVRVGLIRDLSIGFYGGEYICDVCERDLWDWDCPHIPGLKYEPDEGGEAVLATAGIYNARLSEVSTVYKGATPGAAVLKARRLATAGRLQMPQVALLEQRYRVRLPRRNMPTATYRGVDLSKRPAGTAGASNTEEKRMKDGKENPEAGGRIEGFLANLREIDPERFGLATVGNLDDAVAAIRAMGDSIAEMSAALATARPLAEIGRQYRRDLVEEALAEGVRAHGEAFDRERYANLLNNDSVDLDTIKGMRDDWRRIAGERLGGGRRTTDTPEGGEGEELDPQRGVWREPAPVVNAYR